MPGAVNLPDGKDAAISAWGSRAWLKHDLPRDRMGGTQGSTLGAGKVRGNEAGS